jgi:small GTP-binding protein
MGEQQSRLPPGLVAKHTLVETKDFLTQIEWGRTGDKIASAGDGTVVGVWNVSTRAKTHIDVSFDGPARGTTRGVRSLAWDPDGRRLAVGCNDLAVRVYGEGGLEATLRGQTGRATGLTWSPKGNYVACSSDDATVHVWEVPQGDVARRYGNLPAPVNSIAWSPTDGYLAAALGDGRLRVWTTADWKLRHTSFASTHALTSLAWAPDGSKLAVGSDDATINIYSAGADRHVRTLEEHTKRVNSLSFCASGSVLASRSDDGSIVLWDCDTWEALCKVHLGSSTRRLNAVFGSSAMQLAAIGADRRSIVLYDVDLKVLRRAERPRTIRYSSAKIVLVGESNAGKSCIALQLAEGRFESQDTTHGMRVRIVSSDQLSPQDALLNEKRDLVIWDMGGQEEYQLVHQLFLNDTTVALVHFDPTRGRASFDEVEGWNKRLEKQLHGRQTAKILVGTKVDADAAVLDFAAIRELVKKCGFVKFVCTSAKTGRGISELSEAVAAAIDWGELATTSRPELFQKIREYIDTERSSGRVVLLYSELVEWLKSWQTADFDPDVANAVTVLLAVQGLLTDARLASGKRALVLRVDAIERYAGSIILAARDNPRGIPQVEKASIPSDEMAFPGIAASERLPRDRELIVLECVMELLLDAGICVEHEGLLIFPSLYKRRRDVDSQLSHPVALFYDFSGATSNIYSSLVSNLKVSDEFGDPRFSYDRTEFGRAGAGTCGVRLSDRGSGFARLDLYFAPATPKRTRDLFICFVEQHLREHGVDVHEHLDLTCSCGFSFDDDLVRGRISAGRRDVGCPNCDARVEFAEGAAAIKGRDGEAETRTWALKTKVGERKNDIVREAKRVFTDASNSQQADPIRILHISDLHLSATAEPQRLIQPLLEDLRGASPGLGLKHIDYLVVSGDLTMGGQPREFECPCGRVRPNRRTIHQRRAVHCRAWQSRPELGRRSVCLPLHSASPRLVAH